MKDPWYHLVTIETCLLKNKLNIYFLLVLFFFFCFIPLHFELEGDSFQEAGCHVIDINPTV